MEGFRGQRSSQHGAHTGTELPLKCTGYMRNPSGVVDEDSVTKLSNCRVQGCQGYTSLSFQGTILLGYLRYIQESHESSGKRTCKRTRML